MKPYRWILAPEEKLVALLVSIILLVVLSSCWKDIPDFPPTPPPATPTPTPTPTPPPEDPSPICQVGVEDCDCYVKPPGEDWKSLACTPPRICKNKVCTNPTPTPPPPSSCAAIEEKDLVRVTQRAATKTAKVVEAMNSLGDLSLPPGHTQGEYHDRSVENLKKLAARLCAMGQVAIAGIEAIFVLADDGLWEEFHAVFFERGQWIPGGKYIGVHRSTAPPPPADDCPAKPCPIRRWTRENLPPGWGDNEIGNAAWKFNSSTWGGPNIRDYTPVTRRQLSFCEATGQSPMADGNPRDICPMRKEGDPNRLLVETWLLEGPFTVDSRNGQECAIEGRPTMTVNGTGNCRMCNGPKTVCSEWF